MIDDMYIHIIDRIIFNRGSKVAPSLQQHGEEYEIFHILERCGLIRHQADNFINATMHTGQLYFPCFG